MKPNRNHDQHEPLPSPSTTSTLPSRSPTAVDLPAESHNQWVRAEEAPTRGIAEASKGAEVKLGQGRKYFLLLIFSVAQYLDIASYSGLFIFTDAILTDLDIPYQSSSWIITAYSVTFASFLLLWGRVSDLYSAKPVFAWGFLGLGITNLIISFMTNQYAYYVFRAISGVFGAATIPSAFRLILAIFEPAELQVALTLFGLSGALANVTGLVLAGFFGYIKADGQMQTIVIIPFAFAAFALVPKTKGDRSDEITLQKEKLKRLDLPGAFLMFASIVLLILGLTLGATHGFKTAKFLVPFLLSWPLLLAFFVYEARLPPGYALIPPSFWKIPNMPLLIFFSMGIYGWWAVNQLPLVERFIALFGESPIKAAVRMLPQGLAALGVAMVIPPLLNKLKSARWPIAIGMLVGAGAYVLMIYNPEGGIHHGQYWKWYFPAFVVGSGAAMASFLGVNITVMTSVPPSMSGVAGAMLQVALQVGAVIALSVQAGMLTRRPGLIANYENVQASFWFQFGWCLVNLIVFLASFRAGKAGVGSEAAKAQGKAEAGDIEMDGYGEKKRIVA